MKVLQVITSLNVGGAEKLIVDSVPIYQEIGIQTDVLTLKDNDTSFRKSLEKISTGSVIGLTKGTVYNPLLVLKIIPYLKKYDVIHAHLFPVLYWVVLAKIICFSKTPIIYTEHSTNNKRRNNKLLKLVDRFVYKRLDFIGCISEATQLNLKKHLNHKKDNMSVILNGIDLNNFNHSKRENFSFFNEKSFVLIQVSSFREQKDQPTLIKALTFLPQEITLLLVGDGHLRHANEELVKSLELQSRVKFIGIREDIPALMNYSNVCILSSHYEGFGLAILEGMASGKPSIASNLEGVREIVEGYGLLFSPGDSQALANDILRLYKDKKFYNEIARKCLKRAQDFDINNTVIQYINIYRNAKL